MRCPSAQRRLSPYRDGELPKRTRVAMRQHLDGCPVCREALAELNRALGTLASLKEEEPSRFFHKRVLSRAMLVERAREAGVMPAAGCAPGKTTEAPALDDGMPESGRRGRRPATMRGRPRTLALAASVLVVAALAAVSGLVGSPVVDDGAETPVVVEPPPGMTAAEDPDMSATLSTYYSAVEDLVTHARLVGGEHPLEEAAVLDQLVAAADLDQLRAQARGLLGRWRYDDRDAVDAYLDGTTGYLGQIDLALVLAGAAAAELGGATGALPAGGSARDDAARLELIGWDHADTAEHTVGRAAPSAAFSRVGYGVGGGYGQTARGGTSGRAAPSAASGRRAGGVSRGGSSTASTDASAGRAAGMTAYAGEPTAASSARSHGQNLLAALSHDDPLSSVRAALIELRGQSQRFAFVPPLSLGQLTDARRRLQNRVAARAWVAVDVGSAARRPLTLALEAKRAAALGDYLRALALQRLGRPADAATLLGGYLAGDESSNARQPFAEYAALHYALALREEGDARAAAEVMSELAVGHALHRAVDVVDAVVLLENLHGDLRIAMEHQRPELTADLRTAVPGASGGGVIRVQFDVVVGSEQVGQRDPLARVVGRVAPSAGVGPRVRVDVAGASRGTVGFTTIPGVMDTRVSYQPAVGQIVMYGSDDETGFFELAPRDAEWILQLRVVETALLSIAREGEGRLLLGAGSAPRYVITQTVRGELGGSSVAVPRSTQLSPEAGPFNTGRATLEWLAPMRDRDAQQMQRTMAFGVTFGGQQVHYVAEEDFSDYMLELFTSAGDSSGDWRTDADRRFYEALREQNRVLLQDRNTGEATRWNLRVVPAARLSGMWPYGPWGTQHANMPRRRPPARAMLWLDSRSSGVGVRAEPVQVQRQGLGADIVAELAPPPPGAPRAADTVWVESTGVDATQLAGLHIEVARLGSRLDELRLRTELLRSLVSEIELAEQAQSPEEFSVALYRMTSLQRMLRERLGH